MKQNLDYRYNLIENGGMTAGAHLNYLQLGGTNAVDSAGRIQYDYRYEVSSGEGSSYE